MTCPARTSPSSPGSSSRRSTRSPGQVAVDCTLGAAGHARLVADRLGASGTLIAIDRDPLAEEAFAELAAEVACHTRFIRADFEHGLRILAEEGTKADLVYLDLGMSSMQVDTLERGFSYAYDAPLDMRMDPDQELTAREIVNTWERRRLARALREYGEERYADRIAGAIVRARVRWRPPSSSSRRSRPRSPRPPASPAAIPPSAPSRRSGSPSTRSSPSSTRRCRSRGRSCARAAAWPASPSTRSRTGA